MTYSALPVCILTAGSIIIDNIIREPAASTVDADLHLIQNIRQFVEQKNLTRLLLTSLAELQQIGSAAVRSVSVLSPSLTKISEGQPASFYNIQLPQWSLGELQFGNTQFIAEPLSAGLDPFALSHTSQYQSPPIIGSPYGQQLPFPFSSAESGVSMAAIAPHVSPSPPILHQRQQPTIHSSGFQPPPHAHRRTHSSSAVSQSSGLISPQLQQQELSFPVGTSTHEWEPPRRGQSGAVRRGDRRVGHSRSRSRPR